jgi:hypothetical protein
MYVCMHALDVAVTREEGLQAENCVNREFRALSVIGVVWCV